MNKLKIFKDYKSYYNNHKETIKKHNQDNIPAVFVISIFVLLLPFVLAIFRRSMQQTIPAYLLTMVMLTLVLLISRNSKVKEKPLISIYALWIILFLLTLYLSVFIFTNRPAGTILIYFVVAPLIFIERSYRINAFMFVTFLIHLILAYFIKSTEFAGIDLINTLTSTLIGILFGRQLLINRLEYFKMKDLLIIEKETDFLTGLNNRRKLYESFEMKYSNTKNDLQMMVMDIDSFKIYNDTYGHVTGDVAIIRFSDLLKEISKEYQIDFYRYGGDEFIGISTVMSKEEFLNVSETIRIKTTKLSIPHQVITISIGVYTYDDSSDKSLSYILEQADNALYKAKSLGKNKIES